MLAVLIQIDGYDPVAAEAVSLRACNANDDSVCHLDGQVWWPVLATLPSLRYDLFDGAFGGAITSPQSSVSLAVEVWPRFPLLSLADARFRMWTGTVGAPWAGYTLRFDGRVNAQPAIANGLATLGFGVDDRWLDQPLLETFEGTTGAEGDAALKGQPKPLAIGAPRFVPGILIDTVNNVVQVSAYGPIEDGEAAFERLVQFAAPVANYASYAALVAASIPAGEWATAEAVGMVRHGAPPAGRLSYHLKGDKGAADGWVRKPGAIIRRLALLAGGAGNTHDASLAALNASRPYNLSIYQGEQATARDLVQRIAASVNAVAGVSWLGKLFAVPVEFGTPTLTLDASGATLPPVAAVEQLEVAAPFWKLAIGAERTWNVHPLSDVAFSAVLIERGLYDPTESYREGHIASLSDGSRWLYAAAAPSSGNTPSEGSAFWSLLSPAIVPVDAEGVPLSALIAAVRDVADGKTTTFFRSTAPSAAESSENDLWINIAEGNKIYRRVAGSGVLAIGDDRIILGGGGIELCWTEAPDQRIAQALIDAAGAQATADGKVEAFTMLSATDPVPTGSSRGDILYRLYVAPPQIDRWNGSAWVPQATYGATADQASSIAQSAAAVAAIISDAMLSRGEKPAFKREWERAQADHDALVAKAAGFAGVGGAIAALTAAYAALGLAIAALNPPYWDTTQDSVIPDAAAHETAWNNFFGAYASLLMAITAQTLVVQWSVDGETGWHDAYVEGDKWQRQSSDGGATWDAPFKAVGEGIDGKFTSFVFTRAATQPDTPIDDETPPAGWFDAPPVQTVPATALWQTSADFRGAERLTAWAVPKKLVPADLEDLDPGARDLLDQAKSIADGKNKQFWRATPPSAAESQENDIWYNTTQGNRAYRRVPGSGLLAIGGDRIILGGGGIELCWVEAPDQRIAMVVQDVAHTLGIAEEADAKADAAIESLTALADDGVLTVTEKITVLIPKDAQLDGAWAILDDQADDFGITAERAAAAAARSAWLTYRNGLTPAWNATGADTAVVRSTFRSKLGDYEAAIETLKKAISAEAARRAHYSLIVDDNGELPEPNSDVTSMVTGVTEIVISADHTGTPLTGQLPKGVAYRLIRQGVDVTADAAWSRTVISGTITSTVGAANGALSITAISTDAVVRVTAVYGATTRVLDVKVTRSLAPPPSSGSDGGGTAASTSDFYSISSTSMAQITPELSVTVGSAGYVELACSTVFDFQPSGVGGGDMDVYVVWQHWNGSAWVDLTGEAGGTPAHREGGGLPSPFDSPGYVGYSTSVSSLTPGSTQKFRLRARGSSFESVWFFSSSASAQG